MAPHPATVAQPKPVVESPAALPPHPAKMVQMKAPPIQLGVGGGVVQRVAWPLNKLFRGVIQRSSQDEWPKGRVIDEAARLITEINAPTGGSLRLGGSTDNVLSAIAAQLMYIDRLVNEGLGVGTNKWKVVAAAIDISCSLMQDHIFTDGNKRTATDFFKRILAAAGVALNIDDPSLSDILNEYDKPKKIKETLKKVL